MELLWDLSGEVEADCKESLCVVGSSGRAERGQSPDYQGLDKMGYKPNSILA